MNAKEFELDHSLVRDFVKLPSNISFLSESKLKQNKEFLNIHLLIENSYLSKNNKDIVDQVRRSLQSLMIGDLVSVSFFNHTKNQVISLESPESAFLKLNADNLQPFGTNSSAKVLYETLKEIESSKSKDRNIIIQILNSSENSSILNRFKEVIDKAKELNVAIYSVGIGSDIRTYQIQPVSNATGGRFYWLDNSHLPDLSSVINEIYFGNKVNYKFKIKPAAKLDDLEDFELKLSFYNGTTFIDESVQIYLKTPEIFTTNKILSVYNSNESLHDSSYTPQIIELADYLKNNPSKKIQITGHSDNESKGSTSEQMISSERANRLKEEIVSFGVNPHRIRTKGAGSSSPMYFSPQDAGQAAYNRRAEIRWLDEELLPYEISGEKAESEFLAEQIIKKWEDLGYRAYYQRAMEFDEIFYRIIFWGYGNEDQASKESEKLKGTFENIDFKVE
jgi:outer membrane protein OmpA-like peptidoglycan-associated protein